MYGQWEYGASPVGGVVWWGCIGKGGEGGEGGEGGLI